MAFLFSHTEASLVGCELRDGLAAAWGGAVQAAHTSLELAFSLLHNNSAAFDGGAVASTLSVIAFRQCAVRASKSCLAITRDVEAWSTTDQSCTVCARSRSPSLCRATLMATLCGAVCVRQNLYEVNGAVQLMLFDLVSMVGNSAPPGSAQAVGISGTDEYQITQLRVVAPCDVATAASPQLSLTASPQYQLDHPDRVHSVRAVTVESCLGGEVALPMLTPASTPVCSSASFRDFAGGSTGHGILLLTPYSLLLTPYCLLRSTDY